MTRSGRAVAWAAAVAAGVLLAFAPAAAGVRTLAHRDTDRFFSPLRTLVVEALREGRLPLWNPHEAAGKPLFAEGTHSVLHPVSLLGAWLAPASVDFLILGHLVAAALGALALARALGASPPAAAGAGLAFALAGFTVSMAGNLTFLAGLASLPWILAAARAAGAAAPLGPAATALAVACGFFSGDVQATAVGLGLGLLLAAEAGGARGAARALLGMAAGVLLAGVQIAATQELLPETLRGQALTEGERLRWALHPARLLELLVPGLSRGPLAVLPTAPGGRTLELEFSESVFLGAPLLAAAGLALARRRGRAPLALAAGALALLWLALGHRLGGRQVSDLVPLWSRFRYTEKLMGPVTLCVAVLGALGADAFGGGRLGRRWTLGLGAAAAACAAALLALRAAPGPADALAVALVGEAGGFYRANLAAGLPHALLGLLAVLAADRLAGPGARAGALALLLPLAAAAALPSAASLGDPAARAPIPMPLEADGPAPRLIQPVAGRYPTWWNLPYPDAHARWVSLLRQPSGNVATRTDAMDAYCASSPARFTRLGLALAEEGPHHFRRYGLTHVVVPLPFEPEGREVVEYATRGGRLVERDERAGREVWAVPHRPWAFFAARAAAVPGPAEALRAVQRLLDEGDEATVVVEAPAAPPVAPGRVLEVTRGTAEVRIEAEADGPALLVVQDAWWPGWRAELDGRPVEVLAADALVRAVPWPAGRHRLRLTYDPAGVRRGRWLSLAGLVAVAALAALGRRGAAVRGA